MFITKSNKDESPFFKLSKILGISVITFLSILKSEKFGRITFPARITSLQQFFFKIFIIEDNSVIFRLK